ncbi:hypothetical protein YB2330_001340 [Saitoella coloradoensis]
MPLTRLFSSQSRQVFRSSSFGRWRTLGLVAFAAVPVVSVNRKEEEKAPLTHEMQMLEDSERELVARLEVSQDAPIWKRFFMRVALWLRKWITEPIATGFRFVHLVILFAPLILGIPLIFLGYRVKEKDNERLGALWWYAFLVKQMERAGPTFIKLGQWAASRTDIFPTQFCELMSKLHSNAAPHSLHATKRIITEAFHGMKFEDIFEEFHDKPLGVGAIAQVYKAKVRPDLRPPQADETDSFRDRFTPLIVQSPHKIPSDYVAIKVLHPGVEKTVGRDLRIMSFFARVINAIPTMEWLDLPNEVEKFGEMMHLQLDLRIEGVNLATFQENFRKRQTVAFPSPYQAYATREVLIEEFSQGVPLGLMLDIGGGAYEVEIADMGLDAFLHMLLLDNFIHSDLHPGNIMVRFFKPTTVYLTPKLWNRLFGPTPDPNAKSPAIEPIDDAVQRLMPLRHDKEAWNAELDRMYAEGYRPQLVFIDTGLVTELNDINRRNFLDLFKAIAEFDGHRAGVLMVERCRQPDAVLDPDVFALRMQNLVLAVKKRTFALGNIKIGDILNEVLSMVRTHHVRMEGDFVNVVISILLLEGIGRQLNPQLDLFKSALPMLREVGTQRGTMGGMMSDETSGMLTWLKVWVGLEFRSFLSTSVSEVEHLVAHDLIAPNI